jgi:hypothetical protein
MSFTALEEYESPPPPPPPPDDWSDEAMDETDLVGTAGFVDHFAQRIINPGRFTPPHRPPPPHRQESPTASSPAAPDPPPPVSSSSASAVVHGMAALLLIGLAAVLTLTVGRPQLQRTAEADTAVGQGARVLVACADRLHERWSELRPGAPTRHLASSEMHKGFQVQGFEGGDERGGDDDEMDEASHHQEGSDETDDELGTTRGARDHAKRVGVDFDADEELGHLNGDRRMAAGFGTLDMARCDLD